MTPRPLTLTVTVAWATGETQELVSLTLPRGTTIAEAVAGSGLVAAYALDLPRLAAGVFGRRRHFDAVVEDGDRIELYRPLTAEPAEARRRRARGQPAAAGPARGKANGAL